MTKMPIQRKKTGKNTLKELDNGLSFKESVDLQKEYELVLNLITTTQYEKLYDFLVSTDIKFYLKNNQLDYHLFIACIKAQNEDYFEQLLDLGFIFNMNTVLIELYKIFVYKKLKTTPTEEETKEMFTFNDFLFIMNYQEGSLIKEECLSEFYFFLMTNEFELATTLLGKQYSARLRQSLNDIFLDDDSSVLSSILFTEEIVVNSVKSTLERGLDGVAL